jgi:hypothetical protein
VKVLFYETLPKGFGRLLRHFSTAQKVLCAESDVADFVVKNSG